MPQGPAPTAPTHTSQTGGPPWAPPVNIHKKDHQNPLECNGTTNGSTRAPADGKGPEPTKGKNKTSEPHPGTSSGTGSTVQPAGSSKKHNSMFSMWQNWPLEQKLPLLQFL